MATGILRQGGASEGGSRSAMSCFCKVGLANLTATLPSLDLPLPSLPGANLALSLAAQLGSLGLPALPWAPDPLWLDLEIPKIALSASAMATLSALANLRATVMATLGLDLAVAAQATAFARLAATMSAHLPDLSLPGISLGLNTLIQLGSLNFAIDQIRLAMSLNLFLPSLPAFQLPALPQWRVFLSAMFSLLPVISVALQMNIALDASFAANLAASIRPLLSLQLPAVDLSAALTLTGALAAVASLQLSLKINPLKISLPALQAMIAAKLELIPPSLTLPSLPYCPTLMITAPVVSLAASIPMPTLTAVANWQVPSLTAIAALSIGLPTVGLAAAFPLAISASPCGAICDAASVLTAALSGSASLSV